jgi:hypothetical protein
VRASCVQAEARLEAPDGLLVSCDESSDRGEITGPKSGRDEITFTGCETHGVPCQGGASSGTIATLPLETRLVDHGERGASGSEPATGEVWSEYLGEGADNGYLAVFECGAAGYMRIGGTVAGVDGGSNLDHLEGAGTTAFRNGIGEQALEMEVASTAAFAPDETLGPFQASLVMLSTETFESAIDVQP